MNNSVKPPPLVAVLGPTAVGKTALSIQLCRRFGAHVVNADSRQVYKLMDIGTAKPTSAELAHAPHHLIDICHPDETLSLSQYQTLAYNTIDRLHNERIVPFLIGGSALYLRAVVDGLKIPQVPPNPELRQQLEAQAARDGWQGLFADLQALDPLTAERIDPKNVRRLIRALEIVKMTGQSKTRLEGMTPPPYRILMIGLDRPREQLYQRIDKRVEQMVETGLVDEVDRLLSAGYEPTLPSMTSLGYREISSYLSAEITLNEAKYKMKTGTHRFVRHQYTWFRRMRTIRWFNLADKSDYEILDTIEEFLQRT